MKKKSNDNLEIESAKRMKWISKRRKGTWNTVCEENRDIHSTQDKRPSHHFRQKKQIQNFIIIQWYVNHII